MHKHRRTFLFTAIFSALLVPLFAVAATGDTVQSSSSSVMSSSASSESGIGSVTVEQINTSSLYGTWTLIGANEQKHEGSKATETLSALPSGLYTLFVTPPNGAIASIRVYNGTEMLQMVSRPQVSFQLAANASLRISVNYQFTKLGSVSVTSDPGGISFTMEGPNNIKVEGTTPMSFEAQPEGQYKVKFFPPSGCGEPPAKGDILDAGGRISFSITLSCKAADTIRERQEKESGASSDFVTVTVNGKGIGLWDVPKAAWFSSHVASVTKSGIMGGYKDTAGNLTGEFGPGNPVTVAELAKIAHSIAGLSELGGQPPANPGAQNGWFTRIIASAEQRGWIIYDDATIDPARPATRGEVLVTLLQALDVPLEWADGDVFADVTVRTTYAAAIETAESEGLVSGTKDSSGKLMFGPTDNINRAELAKILAVTAQKYRIQTSSSSK